jgi:hypothetical protein
MKWVFLALALACIWPLAQLARSRMIVLQAVWVLIAFLPYVSGELHLYMALITWAPWPGFVTGFEILVVDLLIWVAFLASPETDERFPFHFTMGFYLVAVVLSTLQSDIFVSSLFYVWQFVRIYLIAIVTARSCRDPRVAPAILLGLALAIGMEAGVTLWQRAHGIVQAVGTIGHQNKLGMMINLSVMTFAAIFMARPRAHLAGALVMAAGLIAVLTASRATLGLFAGGVALTFLVSLIRRFSAGKVGVVVVCAALLAVAAPLASGSLQSRFAANPLDAEYDERAAFTKAARAIIRDYPFGIGVNSYVIKVNTGHYNENAGVAMTEGSLSAHVHQAYLLTLAEAGYPGLIAFVCMLLWPMIVAVRAGWRVKDDFRGDILLGLAMGLLLLVLHAFVEWVFVTVEVEILFALTVGMIAGMARQVGYWQAPPATIWVPGPGLPAAGHPQAT